MSLYGLDIVIDESDKPHILEINGIRSGMQGFREIYGDNRVENKVHSMLREKYGKISINDSMYIREYMKRFPSHKIVDSKIFDKMLSFLHSKLYPPQSSVLKSKKALVDWVKDKPEHKEVVEDNAESSFPRYTGQKSTVFNSFNQILPHPLINSYVSEEITRNKFLQYRLLKNTSLKEHLPKSVLVGLGAGDYGQIRDLMESHTTFVIKPLLGLCGMGVKRIRRKDLSRYADLTGTVDDPSTAEVISTILSGEMRRSESLEDLVQKGDFSFEGALAVIQPFIKSRPVIGQGREYSVARAIVCNGSYIDAYSRVSNNFRVNLSRGASAEPYIGPNIAKLCEEAVSILEIESSKYKPKSFKRKLYTSYFNEYKRDTRILPLARLMESTFVSFDTIRNLK